MNRFFNMDNKFFVFMGRVADLLLLNFLCILCCIPVVTAGASITALYYVTLKMARDEESYIARSFFRSFKQNFKQATIINIIMLLTAAVYRSSDRQSRKRSYVQRTFQSVHCICTDLCDDPSVHLSDPFQIF